MLRHFSSCLIVLALCSSSLLAQNPPQPNPSQAQQQKKPETCSVSGRVVSAADGQPLKSARVGLIQEGGGRRPDIFATTTGDDGRFEIKKVTPGRYRFVATHAGFVTQEYQAKGTSNGAVLALAAGDSIDDTIFRLVRAAVISGRVVDDTGEPLVNVTVSALRKPTADELEDASRPGKPAQLMQSYAAVTDDRGDFRIFGIKPGEYFIKASQSEDAGMERTGVDYDPWGSMIQREADSPYAPLYYPGVLQVSEAQSIILRAGEEMQADFALRKVKTVQVAGRVMAADGKPATRAWVNLSIPDVEDFSFDLRGSTDSKGEFLIKGVPPGSYVIMAQQYSEGRQASARQKLDIGEADVDSVVLSFGTGITISGRVTAAEPGLAVERLSVNLSSTDSDPLGGWAVVKPDGSFEINNVSDGSYSVGIGFREPNWYVVSARIGVTDVLQKGIQVEQGTPPGKLEIVVGCGGAQLEGAVTQDEKPIQGAQIRVRPEPETPHNRLRVRSGSTDQNGHFKIDHISPGKYKVVAKLPSDSPDVSGPSSEPQVITLSDHDHQTVQLKLPKPKEE